MVFDDTLKMRLRVRTHLKKLILTFYPFVLGILVSILFDILIFWCADKGTFVFRYECFIEAFQSNNILRWRNGIIKEDLNEVSNESYFEAKFENSAVKDELIPDVEDDLCGKL